MTSKKRFYIAMTVAIAAVAVFWLSTSVGQDRRQQGVQTQIYATPEYRTDAGRAIDAYERTMERYMNTTERNFVGLSADIRAMAVTINAVDAKLTRLDMRLERIERHLGIVLQPVATAPDPNALRPPAPPAPRYPNR